MSLLALAGTNSATGGYDVDYSCKFEHDNAESLSRAQAQGNQQTWTFSTWIKRTQLAENSNEPYQNIWSAGSSTSNATHVYFRGDSSYPGNQMFFYMDNGGSQFWHGRTPQSFRDTSAWYHLVWAVDTTQGTASNRSKIYINGEQITLDNVTYPNQNASTRVMDNGGDMYIGALAGNGGYRFNGYLAETVLIDGSQLSATDFGEFDEDTGIWKPIDVSELSFGTRGFYLDYSDAANLGNDADGSTVFTENYLTAADQATDTPTNNFCTFNPLMYQNNPPTISEGSMKSTGVGGAWSQTWGNIGVKNGKWYYEFKVANTSSTGYFGASTTPAEGSSTAAASVMYNTSFMLGQSPRIDYYYWQNGSQVSNESTGWGTISTNDVIGIALDLDSATKTFTAYKNGTALSGTLSQPVALPTNMQDEFIFPLYVQYNDRQDEANFGGYTISSISTPASDENGYGTFEYAPPSGYYALCTKNLEEFG